MSKKRKFKIYIFKDKWRKYSVQYKPGAGWLATLHPYGWRRLIRKTKEKAIKDIIKQLKDHDDAFNLE